MGIRSKLERIERALSSERVYTPDDFKEIEELPDSAEISFDWGEVLGKIQELRAKAQGKERGISKGTDHVRSTKVGEVKAFFGFLERVHEKRHELD